MTCTLYIVVSSLTIFWLYCRKKIMNKIVRYAIVKVIDFGISKNEIGSNPKEIENNYIYGSTTYMALEILKNKYETMTMCPFDSDVFSFAIVCCKILSNRDPFDDCKRAEILERIERGERSELPSNCDELAEPIKECWNLNPLHRPKFANICERFVMLKKMIMSGVIVAKTPYYGASKDNGHENIELQQTPYKLVVPKLILLNEVDMVEEVLGRKQCLLHLLNLCVIKVKVLCRVGIGGVGKSTIAKTSLSNVKYMYDASCFVECDESGNDCYKSSCHILEQLKVEAKPKDLKEAQEMLKLILTQKKVIIVFDNVINLSQIKDVVPMDDLFAMSGSTS
uniref:Protein kinase domain-containing protein n=1 Tax=Physcomitrium patens TaxID=3218 RepID=A0A2K1JKK5_PHYPA|nr:hypothetical protein PHYPA_016900 [Physcomitrium patens]